MPSSLPNAAAIAATRQRLSQFSCLTTPPTLTTAEATQVRDDLRYFNEWSDYQTLGICASSLAEGQRSLELFLAALGIAVSLDLPDRDGAIYLKFNTLKGAWYLDDYSGPSRGVLITFHTSEPETAELAGTYGPFPFDLFADPSALAT
ncbi:DUF1824 family protein [Nodosilinea sp. E11]|uniref:DUF1824 family protein n=1 Tax=Nodosilinea sp. E11 TaxID=3037479 RepID=UPI002934161F|nr:DUF1824 family protein [Nodosilinea sp. E11]WOD40940.1 DUF1824 family protein [Nodosilinea sp. E11]